MTDKPTTAEMLEYLDALGGWTHLGPMRDIRARLSEYDALAKAGVK
jgi:hypothetical protein